MVGGPAAGDGWEVVWVPAGATALTSPRQAPPDLLVTDWNMPGVDGLALCLAFRDDLTLRTVPIILAWSLTSPDDSTPPLYDAFLQKPVTTVALLAVASALMQRAAPSGPPPDND